MTHWPENGSHRTLGSGARLKLLAMAVAGFTVVAIGAYGFASQPVPQPKPVPQENNTGIIRTTPDTQAQQMPPPVKGDNG